MEVNVVLIDDHKENLRHLVDWLKLVKDVQCEADVFRPTFHPFRPENSRDDPLKVDLDATLTKVLALEPKPGVAVIDLRLEGHEGNDYSGADLSRSIKEACNDCCIILVSHYFGKASDLPDHIKKLDFRVDLNQADHGQELQNVFTEAIRRYARAMSSHRRTVYISYARDDQGDTGSSREEIVNRIESSLLRHGYDVRRDARNLRYTGLISAFMKEIGTGGCVVAVLSEKYLRSPFCMYELLEVHRNQDFHKRLCPVVLPGARLTHIGDRIDYVSYWSTQFDDVQKRFRKIKRAVPASEELEELRRYRDISQEAGKLLALVANMYQSTCEELEKDDFAILRKRIDECLK